MKKAILYLILAALLVLFNPSSIAQVNISPNMSLPIPIPGITPGPTWAANINSSFLLIDQHNHSAGEGVQINPNGLNINSDLTFGGNNATHLRTTRFTPQSGPITNSGADVGELYVSGNEIYYNDVSGGHQVQITTNGSVNAGAGSITGLPSGTASASYSAGTFTWQSATNTAANMDFRSAILRNATANSKGLTLNPPAAMGANITETFPTIPAGLSFMTMDSSGNMGTGISTTGGITGSMIASTTIVNGNFATGTKVPLVVSTKTAAYTALSSDGFILTNTNAGNLTITLYSPSSFPGLPINIKKISNDANIATILTPSGNIDGSGTTLTMATGGEDYELIPDGTNWQTISHKSDTTPLVYTPSFAAGFGTTTAISFKSWREGRFLVIFGTFTLGTVAGGSNASITIGFNNFGAPANLAIDTGIIPSGTATVCGYWTSNNATNISGPILIVGSSTQQMFLGVVGASTQGGFISDTANFSNSAVIQMGPCRIPISGWAN